MKITKHFHKVEVLLGNPFNGIYAIAAASWFLSIPNCGFPDFDTRMRDSHTTNSFVCVCVYIIYAFHFAMESITRAKARANFDFNGAVLRCCCLLRSYHMKNFFVLISLPLHIVLPSQTHTPYQCIAVSYILSSLHMSGVHHFITQQLQNHTRNIKSKQIRRQTELNQQNQWVWAGTHTHTHIL